MFQAASAHHQEDQIVLIHKIIHKIVLFPECVIPDDVLIKFGPPDDEHLLLETCRGVRNKYIKKERIKLVITQNFSAGVSLSETTSSVLLLQARKKADFQPI
jgi:hypothetical protein